MYIYDRKTAPKEMLLKRSITQTNFSINSHPATRCRGNVLTTSLCMSHRLRKYVSNEKLHYFSVEGRKVVSVVRPQNVLLERSKDVWRGRNNNVPSIRLHDVANKSQMKHPTTSQWYITKTFQWNISSTPH